MGGVGVSHQKSAIKQKLVQLVWKYGIVEKTMQISAAGANLNGGNSANNHHIMISEHK